MTAFRLLLAVLLIGPLSAGAEIYKWTDAQGRLHYSDKPPPGAKAKPVRVMINSIEGPATVTTLRSAPATKAREKEKVRIFTAVWCGYCKRAKAHLAEKGVPYEELDVETSEQGRNEFSRLGGRGVPLILVGSQRMDGFDARGLDAMLAGAGW